MSDVTITVRANGPYKVVGTTTIVDADGRAVRAPGGVGDRALPVRPLAEQAVLRRSHKRVGFVADDTAPRAHGAPEVSD